MAFGDLKRVGTGDGTTITGPVAMDFFKSPPNTTVVIHQGNTGGTSPRTFQSSALVTVSTGVFQELGEISGIGVNEALEWLAIAPNGGVWMGENDNRARLDRLYTLSGLRRATLRGDIQFGPAVRSDTFGAHFDSSGTLHALGRGLDGNGQVFREGLFTINSSTRATTHVASFPSIGNVTWHGLTVHPTTGRGWTTARDSGTAALTYYSIDLTTGAFKAEGSAKTVLRAIHPITGMAYGFVSDNQSAYLVTIDLSLPEPGFAIGGTEVSGAAVGSTRWAGAAIGDQVIYRRPDQPGTVTVTRPQNNRMVADLSDPDGRIVSVESAIWTRPNGTTVAGVRTARRNNFPDQFRTQLRENTVAGTYSCDFTYTDPGGTGKTASGSITI